MALEDYEQSQEQAQPLFLYAFTLGERAWRFASSAYDVMTPDGKLWTACPISHSGVKQTGEVATDGLTINCPTAIAPAQIYMLTPPSADVNVTIFQKDEADGEYVAIYVGEVKQVNPQSPVACVITCETLSASLDREGLRIGWQRSCPYALYDSLTCKVNKALYAVPAVITAIDGFNVTVSGAISPSIYVGGFFEWLDPVKGMEYRGIEAQSGNVLLVFGTTIDLYVGLSVTLYRGCDRSPAACASFNNFDNYGGFPAMPGKSPFDGDPVFY